MQQLVDLVLCVKFNNEDKTKYSYKDYCDKYYVKTKESGFFTKINAEEYYVSRGSLNSTNPIFQKRYIESPLELEDKISTHYSLLRLVQMVCYEGIEDCIVVLEDLDTNERYIDFFPEPIFDNIYFTSDACKALKFIFEDTPKFTDFIESHSLV